MKSKSKNFRRQILKFINKKTIAIALIVAFPSAYLLDFFPHSESYLRARVVELISSNALCSGEQIHIGRHDYILTASHCKMLANKDNEIFVLGAQGQRMYRKVLAEDPKSDLLLLEGLPDLKGIEVASFDWIGEKIRTFTHGLGRPTYETKGSIEGTVKISALLPYDDGCSLPKETPAIISTPFGNFTVNGTCVLNVTETKTDAESSPGSSGGMAVNSLGHLIGVVSAGDTNMTGLVRLSDIHRFLKDFN